MKRTLLWLLLSGLGVPGVSSAAEPVGFAALEVSRWPQLRTAQCRQESSYDRSGGNDDKGHFVARRGTVAVLADVSGPGCIYRLWSANPGGQLKIYFDGETTPRIDLPLADLFAGRVPPFLPPFVGQEGGGGYCYLPLPFRRGCRIEVENASQLYYQVTYHTFPQAGAWSTFSPEKAVPPPEVREFWTRIQRGQDRPVASGEGQSFSLHPGQTFTLLRRSGPGLVRAFSLRVSPPSLRVLRRVVLRMYWDREPEPSVECPLPDFFASGLGLSPLHSLPLSVAEGWLTCRFPLPFAREARLTLTNRSHQTLHVTVSFDLAEGLAVAGLGRFHAQYRHASTVYGEPYVLLEARGRGHYVGASVALVSSDDLGYLEGDERIFVDGEVEPSLRGTGTEDYFNGGWYFLFGRFCTPLAGAPLLRADKQQTAAYRWHLGDVVPFRQRLRVELEHGGANDVPGAQYRSVAYWYQTEPHAPFPAWEPLPAEPTYAEPGVIEAEEWAQREVSGAKVEVCADPDLPQPASGGHYARLQIPPGGSCSLPLSVGRTEGYELRAQVVAGPDGGPFQIQLANHTWELNTYAPEMAVRLVSLGRLRLQAGDYTLQVTSLQPEASTRLAWDYLHLVPVEHARGAVEAEALEILSHSPGAEVKVEEWREGVGRKWQWSERVEGGGRMGEPRWSGAAQVIFRPQRVGDEVTLALPVQNEGKYEVAVSFARGPTFGRVQVLLDGRPLGPPVDTYAPTFSLRDRVGLGVTPPLREGTHRLTLRSVGKNEAATGLAVGFDYLHFSPLLRGYNLENLPVEEHTAPVRVKERFGAEPRWQGGAYLHLQATKKGDAVTLTLPVPRTGRYALQLHLARLSAGGQFQTYLDGRPVGGVGDNYHQIESRGSLSLGEVDLHRGPHPLRLVVTGKNPASGGYELGLDALELTLLQAYSPPWPWLLVLVVLGGAAGLWWRKRRGPKP